MTKWQNEIDRIIDEKVNIQAFSEEKIFEIDADNNLNIFDENRGKKGVSIYLGKINNSKIAEKTNGNMFSLSELNKLIQSNKDITLEKPESFIQVLIHKNIYKKNKGWSVEKKAREDNNNDRHDIRFTISGEDSNKLPTSNTIAIVEIKNFKKQDKSGKLSLSKKQEEGENQLRRYFSSEFKLNSDKTADILGQVLCVDAEHIFFNPYLCDDIVWNMEYPSDFFSASNFLYSNEKNKDTIDQDIGTMKKIILGDGEHSSLIDIVNVDHYSCIPRKKFQIQTLQISPYALSSLNTIANPRAMFLEDALQISVWIMDDIYRNFADKKNIEFYKSLDYTTQKEIYLSQNANFLKENNESNSGQIYGFGLSLQNGQHSTLAYLVVMEVLKNLPQIKKDISKYQSILGNRFNTIIKLAEKIYETQNFDLSNLNSKTKARKESFFEFIENLNEGFFLNTKITVAKSKALKHRKIEASNSKVGKIDKELSIMMPLLLRINHKLSEKDVNLQVKIPNTPQKNNYKYVDHTLIYALHRAAEAGEFGQALNTSRKSGINFIRGFKSFLGRDIEILKENFGSEFISNLMNSKRELDVNLIQKNIEEYTKDINNYELGYEMSLEINDNNQLEHNKKHWNIAVDKKNKLESLLRQFDLIEINPGDNMLDTIVNNHFLPFNSLLQIIEGINKKSNEKNKEKISSNQENIQTARLAFRLYKDYFKYIKATKKNNFVDMKKYVNFALCEELTPQEVNLNCAKCAYYIDKVLSPILLKDGYSKNAIFDNSINSEPIYEEALKIIIEDDTRNLDRILNVVKNNISKKDNSEEISEEIDSPSLGM